MLRQKIKEKKDMDGAGMQAKIELFYSSKVTSLFSNASRYSSNSNSKQSSARVSDFGNKRSTFFLSASQLSTHETTL